MEFLKALISSWPVVGLLLGCFAIIVLRRSFADLIGRVRARIPVSKGELLLDPASAATIQVESKPATDTGLDVTIQTGSINTDRLRKARDIDKYPIIGEQEGLIRADLGRLGADQNEQIELLIKHLAVAQLAHRAELIYRLIFGSQIVLLKFLNTRVYGTTEQLLGFYEAAKAEYPALYAGYAFDQYLNFLLTQVLISRSGNDQYSITMAGKALLVWMAEAGVTEKKAF